MHFALLANGERPSIAMSPDQNNISASLSRLLFHSCIALSYSSWSYHLPWHFFFSLPNPSSRTVALGSTQVLIKFLNWYSEGVESKVHSPLRPLLGLLCQPRVIMIMDKLVEWLAGETEVLGENLPQCRFVHHKPHMPARSRTRAAAVGSQRLTAWATARPTQPLTEMNTRNIPGGLKANCEPVVYKMWEPRRLTTLWAFTACYRDSFTLHLILYKPFLALKYEYNSELNWTKV
jgi:hypothetical protein